MLFSFETWVSKVVEQTENKVRSLKKLHSLKVNKQCVLMRPGGSEKMWQNNEWGGGKH